MGKVSNPGHYWCPRCKGEEFYESQETTGAYAVTLNTPGPVDPTFVNRIQGTVVRCVNCGEKAQWIDSPEAIAEKSRVNSLGYGWVGSIGGAAFLFLALYGASLGLDDVAGVIWACLGASALFFFIGYKGFQSANKK
ncbi:MAG: hypothetical protein RJB54_317 [Actinomycetota bacterium]|jgi:ribosomal protein L37E